MSLIDRITALEAELEKAEARTADEVERFRVAMLGRNGAVTELFEAFKQVAGEEKRLLGQRMNVLKQAAQARFEALKSGLVETNVGTGPSIDLTAPMLTEPAGS
ncbi:MAG TPA: phenylalanine--tRNA ligase subunit alpha, partial [Flavobacteriales bacterium]|nr:phenylalanine--tRNA ligase subunit alpha [Flavobacteriales bacterium]